MAHLLPGGLPGGVQAYKLPPLQESDPVVAASATDSVLAEASAFGETLCSLLPQLLASSRDADEAAPFAVDDGRVLAVGGRANEG